MLYVLIPTYNRANIISRALNSIFNQEYKNYKIVIVDDGSTDNTEIVIDNYSKNYPWIIYYFKKENWWVWSARNYWIEQIIKISLDPKKDFILFLDSDDSLYNEKSLNTVVDSISSYSNINVFYFWVVDNLWYNTFSINSNVLKVWFYDVISWENVSWEFCPIIRVSMLKDNEYRFMEDVNWWELFFRYSILLKYEILIFSDPIRIYYKDLDWITRGELTLSKINNIIKINRRLIDMYLTQYLLYNKKELSNIYMVLARMYALSWNRFIWLRFFLSWLKYWFDYKRIILLLLSFLPFWLFINNCIIRLLQKKFIK